MHRSRVAGFTLIELLIVIVIIGILAAIAIPSFKNTKAKAYVASMKSDLRNLATAEEAYDYQNDVYTDDLDQLKFNPSDGVTITIPTATGAGWAAKATHPLADPGTCAIFVGNVTALAPATVRATITCE